MNIKQVLDAAPPTPVKVALTADQLRIRRRRYSDKWIQANRDSINAHRRAKRAEAKKLMGTPPREAKVRQLKPVVQKPVTERDKLTQGRLKELFSYDPETGLFKRRESRGNSKVGKSPGWLTRRGYSMISIDHHTYLAHRLAWLYMTGAWPNGDIDHINGDLAGNHWSNLRDVTKSTNAENQRRAHKGNSTGFLGVYARKNGFFVAHITVRGNLIYLGHFKDAESASAVYLKAKRELHEGCTI